MRKIANGSWGRERRKRAALVKPRAAYLKGLDNKIT